MHRDISISLKQNSLSDYRSRYRIGEGVRHLQASEERTSGHPALASRQSTTSSDICKSGALPLELVYYARQAVADILLHLVALAAIAKVVIRFGIGFFSPVGSQ